MLLIVVMLVLAPQVQAKKRPKINVVQVNEPDDSWILTTEDNSYYTTNYGNISLEHSGADGLDIGLSVQNISLSGSGDAQNYNNDSYLQVSKTYDTDFGEVSFGSQNGFHFASQNTHKLHSFEYFDALYEATDYIKVHSGIYYVNKGLSTTDHHVGFITGIIIGDSNLYIQTDYFSGHSNVSGAQSAIYYSPYPFIKAYTGVLVPEKNSGNEFAGVIGVQWIFNN